MDTIEYLNEDGGKDDKKRWIRIRQPGFVSIRIRIRRKGSTSGGKGSDPTGSGSDLVQTVLKDKRFIKLSQKSINNFFKSNIVLFKKERWGTCKQIFCRIQIRINTYFKNKNYKTGNKLEQVLAPQSNICTKKLIFICTFYNCSYVIGWVYMADKLAQAKYHFEKHSLFV